MEQLDIVTGPFGYVRLLGDRKAVDDLTPTLDHIVIDRSEQIRDDAKAIKKLSESVPVIVAVNNHFAGYSPQTIKDLLAAIEKG
jgi:glutaredoxin